MLVPTLQELNASRKEGFKPTVVVCILHDKKLLFFLKKEFKLWQLPQSSLKNNEDPLFAVKRNIEEEIGKHFLTTCDPEFQYLGFDQVEMLPGKTKETEFTTDEGESVKMMGKKFHFFAVNTTSSDVNISETQFDESLWCKFKAAVYMAKTIHQPGKKRITTKAVNLLKDANIIE